MHRLIGIAPLLGGILALAGMLSGCDDPKVMVQPGLPGATGSVVSASTGNDSNNGTPAAPYKTITHALSLAMPGIPVIVLPGTYDTPTNGETFPLIVPAGVMLIGDEPNKGVGAPQTLITGSGVIPLTALSGTIDLGIGATAAGFTVTGTGNTVVYLGAGNATLRNNTLTGPGEGIYVSSSNNAIVGNVVQNNAGDGLLLSSGTGTKIEFNTFTANINGVNFSVPGDLGGGSTGSAGGNLLYCNGGVDLSAAVAVPIFARNNGWDHVAPTVSTVPSIGGVDSYDPNLIVDTTGAFIVASPCAFTFFVSAATGSDANNGTPPAPFKTITHALAVASQGEWIQVLPGTYDALSNGETFPVTVPAGVTLIGDEPNKGMGVPATLISGDGLVNGVSGGAIKAGIGATIAGFQLVDAVGTFIVYLDANGVTVRNNSLPGPSSANAIYINSSSNHVIAGNFEQNNARGLGIVGTSSGTRVENNTFRGNAYGVEFDVPGGDLGGGPTGSVGGNLIYCNTANDLWTNAGAAVPAMNNGWDHNPQTLGSGGGADIYDPGLIVNSSGAFQATGPCLNTFVVNATTGLDSNTGAAGSPFKTITHALSLTGSGDTVQVQPGTYDVINGEIYPIAVPAGVSLIGDEVNKGMGGTPTVISGDGVVSGGLTGAIKAGIGATIAGFQIADTVGNFTVYLGANGITLRNNTMPGPSTNAAIYFDSSSNHFITGNVGQNNNWGILAQGTASGSRIENNNFSFNLYGLEFDTAAGDLGGGATGSVGGNLLYCNSFNDLWTNSPVSARNNGWDHLPPTSQDINNLPVVDSTGAFQVAVPCP